MASLGLWKARLFLSQQRRSSSDANRSVFTLRPLPSKIVDADRRNKSRRQHERKPCETITDRGERQLTSFYVTTKNERIRNEETASLKTPSSSSVATKDTSKLLRSRESDLPADDCNKQTVCRDLKKAQNRWVKLLQIDLERYHKSLAENNASKLLRQREFGDALRKQIENNAKNIALEKKKKIAESEQIIKDVKEKEKEEQEKQRMQKEIVAKNCMFIQEQLRLRREAAEKSEQIRQRLDQLAREELQKKLENEKQAANEARRRIRADLQQNRLQNEIQVKERAKMLAEERNRDIDEQRRNIAAMEAAEIAKQKRIKKIADKTAALEKESEKIAHILQQKQTEEERRIKKYQEECDLRDKEKEIEKRRRQKALIDDIKISIKLQLDERKKALLKQAAEAQKMALSARELAVQEQCRVREEKGKAGLRRRQYKAELDRQIQLRKELYAKDIDDMDENELAINRALLQ